MELPLERHTVEADNLQQFKSKLKLRLIIQF